MGSESEAGALGVSFDDVSAFRFSRQVAHGHLSRNSCADHFVVAPSFQPISIASLPTRWMEVGVRPEVSVSFIACSRVVLFFDYSRRLSISLFALA